MPGDLLALLLAAAAIGYPGGMTPRQPASRPDAASTGWRALKTLGLAGLIAFFGSAAHVAGGGSAPASALFFALLLPLLGACLALSRFRLGFLRSLGTLALGQVYMHLLLSATAHSPAAAGGTTAMGHGAGAHAGHGGGADPASMMGAAAGSAQHAATGHDMAGMDHSSPSMLLMHVLGTLVSAAMVASVEAMLWVLAVLILPWIVRLLPLVLPAPVPRAVFWRLDLPRISPRVRPSDPPRGPPLLLASS